MTWPLWLRRIFHHDKTDSSHCAGRCASQKAQLSVQLTESFDAHLREVERQVRWLESRADVMRAERHSGEYRR